MMLFERNKQFGYMYSNSSQNGKYLQDQRYNKVYQQKVVSVSLI